MSAARHPEQGENEEAVSDSVNTVASLTGLTLRYVLRRVPKPRG